MVFVRMPDTLLVAACLSWHEVISRKAYNVTNQSKSNNAGNKDRAEETNRLSAVECLNNGNGRQKKKGMKFNASLKCESSRLDCLVSY